MAQWTVVQQRVLRDGLYVANVSEREAEELAAIFRAAESEAQPHDSGCNHDYICLDGHR